MCGVLSVWLIFFLFCLVATVYPHRWCAQGFVQCAGCKGTLWSCFLLVVAQNDEMSVWMVLLVGPSSVRNDCDLSVLDGSWPSDVEKVCSLLREEKLYVFLDADRCTWGTWPTPSDSRKSGVSITDANLNEAPCQTQWPYRYCSKSTDSIGSELEQIVYPFWRSCRTFDAVLYLAVREAFKRSVIRGSARCICKLGSVAFWVGKSLTEKKCVKSDALLMLRILVCLRFWNSRDLGALFE